MSQPLVNVAGETLPTPDSTGLCALFQVAEEDTDIRPFAGLTILSQVAEGEGIANVHAIHPKNMLMPHRCVGLRAPCNEERDAILAEQIPDEVAKTKMSPAGLYEAYCGKYKVKKNSALKTSFSHTVGDYSMKELSTVGNLLGDRGILPVLEVVRLCEGLTTLNMPDNGLRNSAIECIVHMGLSHPGLTAVDISSNRVTLGGGKVLQELVRKNPRLVRVNMEGTRIEGPLQERIQTQLQKNRESAGK